MYQRRGNAKALCLLRRMVWPCNLRRVTTRRLNNNNDHQILMLSSATTSSSTRSPSSCPGISHLSTFHRQHRQQQLQQYRHHSSSFGKNSLNRSSKQRKLTLKEARDSVRELVIRLDNMMSEPVEESSSQQQQQQQQQKLVLDGAKEALNSIFYLVNQGYLNPSGKHGKEMSNFMELILYAYCQVATPPPPPPVVVVVVGPIEQSNTIRGD